MMGVTSREYRQPRFRTPPGACEILLVRHGESAAYREGERHPMLDGHGDPPLHEEGHRQALRVADRLVSTGEKISAIYATTLQRTVQTAQPLADRLNLPVRIEARLREVSLGEWEGGEYRRRVAEGDPLAVRAMAEERWDLFPGAESTEGFSSRVREGVTALATAHPDEVVVAVVHGGVIGQIISLATGCRPFAFVGADNASISHIVVGPQRWSVRCFNDTSHLTPQFSTAGEPFAS
jgi:2,3-bisphosphoglycerate-dependent phosphoglycerate mutase